MKELFEAVRGACSTSLWSKGVALSRQDRTYLVSRTPEELVLTIETKELASNPVVTLWPQEEDWNCDCISNMDPCEHVVAATIAVKKAEESGVNLPKSGVSLGLIEYHFTRENRGLCLHRLIMHGKSKTPLSVSLLALSSGKLGPIKIAPSKEDLSIDHAMDGVRKGGVLEAGFMNKILGLLKTANAPIFLDGEPIKCEAKPIGASALFKDEGAGVFLKSHRPQEILEVFSNGVILRAGTPKRLHPRLKINLAPELLTALRQGQYYGPKDFAFLASELIPQLKDALPVIVKSHRIPQAIPLSPRIAWEARAQHGKLGMRPTLVYGDPICAKVEGERLTFIASKPVPIRQIQKEKQLRESFAERFPLTAVGNETRFSPAEGSSFLQERIREGFEILGDGKKQFEIHESIQLDLPSQYELGQAWEISFTANSADGDKRSASPEDVINTWKNGESLVPLLEGGFAPLPQKFFETHGPLLVNLLNARSSTKQLPNCMGPALADFYQDLNLNLPRNLEKFRENCLSFRSLPEVSPPRGLKAKLRPYQQEGLNWLNFLQNSQMGALLADDMGLGKTLQTIACIKGKTLIIAPTSVIENWHQELKRFRPSLNVSVFHGAGRKLNPSSDVIITSYALLRLEGANLETLQLDMLVLDEAQWIKNPRSQAAISAWRLNANFKLALSGTPVENKLEDLWSIFQFINPGLLGTKAFFAEHFSKPIAAGSAEVTSMLKRKIKPFVLRRLKSEVAKDLPSRTDLIRYCQLSEGEQQRYEALRQASRKEVMEKLNHGNQALKALELLLRLRQAACHPALLDESLAASSSSAKLELLVNSLEVSLETGSKCLVFSQWTRFLDLIGNELSRMNLPYLRIDGSTNRRQDVVAAFQERSEKRILLLSLKAAGVGLNLTKADHVFICDPWWNPAAENQAADRAHRIGQDKPVMVTRLVAKGTVEEKILLLQDKKRSLAKALVDSANGAIELGREDLLELLA